MIISPRITRSIAAEATIRCTERADSSSWNYEDEVVSIIVDRITDYIRCNTSEELHVDYHNEYNRALHHLYNNLPRILEGKMK